MRQWRADNPQLSAREDMYSFLLSNSNPQSRKLTSTDSTIDGEPYIMHTTNEYYANKQAPEPYQEACHVVTLRTPTKKFVYYYTWAAPAAPLTLSQYQFDNSAAPDSDHSEYYNLATDPGERTNLSSSISSGAQTTFLGVIGSELQVSLSPANGVNLNNLRATAGGNYVNYIAPPTGLAVTPTSFPHDPVNPVTLTITATGGVSAGPSIDVLQVILGIPTLVHTFYIQDTAPVPPTLSAPFTISFVFGQPATYVIKLKNASSSFALVTVTAT